MSFLLFIFRYNKSTAQLLIRWCLERGFICIPKSVKEQRTIENGDIFDFKISDEDMQVLVCLVATSHDRNYAQLATPILAATDDL